MSSSFLLFVSCVLLIGGYAEARPTPHIDLREINDIHDDHVSNVMLGVRNITNSSAILDWNVPDDRPVLNFKISCIGSPKNAMLTVADTQNTNDQNINDHSMEHSLEHIVSMDIHTIALKYLKSDYSYSCTLLATELRDGQMSDEWKKIIAPIGFSTLAISTGESKSTASTLNFDTFKEKYGGKSAYIILGGGVPLCIAIIAAGVGMCVLCRKCNAYRERKNNNYRRVNEDKLNRRLKGVVYNPMTTEYTTKWHQPKTMTPPPPSNFQDNRQYRGQASGNSTFDKKVPYGRLSTFDKKVPYGRLSLKELVQRIEQARMQSPYAESYKSNDPWNVDTPFFSCSSLSSSITSIDSSDGDVIRTQPVIPNMNLSTPAFKQPRKMKMPTKHTDGTNKAAGLRKSTSRPSTFTPRPCTPRPHTKAILVQPDAELESDSGSSIDIILPQFPPCEGIVHT